MKLAFPWHQSQRHKKTRDQSTSLMSIYEKIIDKILANWLQHDQEGFIPGMQGWFNIQKSINVIYHINWMKEKTRMIILKQKKCWQNSQPFHDQKTRNRKKLPQHNKKPYMKTPQQTHTQWWKIESFTSKIRTKTKTPTFITSILLLLEVAARAIRHEKEKTSKLKKKRSNYFCLQII